MSKAGKMFITEIAVLQQVGAELLEGIGFPVALMTAFSSIF